jgi:hypothetical protein
MDKSSIEAIAKAIASEQMNSMWYIYLLMLLITIVGSFVGSILLSYAKKKGEIKAISAHFETLQKQLKLNTKITEEIKVEVNHSDWLKREWKALRQKKLEELLQNVYQADHWQKTNKDATLFGSGKDPGSSPKASVKFLSALYFPELKSEIEDLIEANKKLSDCVSVNKNTQIPNHLLANEFNSKWKPLYEEQMEKIKILEEKSATLISAL